MNYLIKKFIEELKQLVIRENLIWSEPIVRTYNHHLTELKWFSTNQAERKLVIGIKQDAIETVQVCNSNGIKDDRFDVEKFTKLWKWLND
jgi:hypothetical protein